MRKMPRRALVAVAAVIATSAWLVPAGGAQAQTSGSRYKVTFVARSCPEYTDIFANRARNDILESLQDLGPDTQYGDSGRLINPTDESTPPQDACKPLPNWEFTLGHSYQTRASVGEWGALSAVTDPFPRAPIVTQVQTPLLDEDGVPVGKEKLAGATTITLTNAERQQASSGQQLWAQGGTPTDPVLTSKFPGPQYAFGALRCASDNLNGDNVEYIYFPSGVTHVFCYAFYVTPPPTAGEITIEKRVTGARDGMQTAFPFTGNLSYNPDGFQLVNGQSEDFFRAGTKTWDVTEGSVDNYRLASIDCTTQTIGGGPPQSRVSTSGSTTSIALVAGEHVTCVYNNAYVPPVGGLTVRKITRGATGTFRYSVTPSAGGGGHALTATTTEQNVAQDAVPSLTSLAPGSYRIHELPTHSNSGRWKLVAINCDGSHESTSGTITVTIHPGQASVCTFTNAFIPAGAISIAKITEGATGTADFLIQSESGVGPPRRYLQRATSTKTGTPFPAQPVTAADATSHLRLGRYEIVEQVPPGGVADGWALTSVECNGSLLPFAEGTVMISLTPREPRVHCTYVDTFTAHPPPPPVPPSPPAPPEPPTKGGTVEPSGYELSDLAVTKQASASVAIKGHAVSYRITVTNHGPDAAERVVVADLAHGQATLVSVTSSRGRCIRTPVVACALGTLKPGARAVINVKLIPDVGAGEFTNRAVAGTATRERTLSNNLAKATVRVIGPKPPPPVGRG